MDTPWGQSQDVTDVADGVQFVSTAGHGGYRLSAARLARMPESLKTVTDFYKGGPWFEEDCEWARVAMAFPELFPADAQEAARSTLAQTQPAILAKFDLWVSGHSGFTALRA